MNKNLGDNEPAGQDLIEVCSKQKKKRKEKENPKCKGPELEHAWPVWELSKWGETPWFWHYVLCLRISHNLAAGLFSTRLVVLHVISSENSHAGFTNRMKEALRKEKVWQAISRRSVHLQLREQRDKKMGGGGGNVIKGRLCGGALLALKGLCLLNSVHRSS